MRIHLGHHFYGAGNLGDDFMLAGFLSAMRSLAPAATFTACVPFALEPLRRRFPEISWQPYEDSTRCRAIAECDVWLGLGGSPFQSALSRWFVDHLLGETGFCTREHKPMFFLGVGVQTPGELTVPDVRRICAHASGIWTRDAKSAQRIGALPSPPPVEAAADLAHLFFRVSPPPSAEQGVATLVPNFDYGAWSGQAAVLAALEGGPARDHVWLAQESRALPGAERALHATLSPAQQARWRLIAPEREGVPLHEVIRAWPSGEWLITARYHAALAGAWARSKVIVLSTNEKLRAAAHELHAPLLSPDADLAQAKRTLDAAVPATPPRASAELAFNACAAFVRSAVAHRR